MAVNGYIVPTKMIEDVGFSETNLTSAFIEQASKFSYYAAAHARAERQEARLKHRVDIVEAMLDRRFRKEAKESGEKVTEPQIAKMIICEPEHQTAVSEYIDGKQVSNVCKAAVEAFRHRRDMLIQIGADAREEKKGQMRVVEPTDHSSRAMSVVSRLGKNH